MIAVGEFILGPLGMHTNLCTSPSFTFRMCNAVGPHREAYKFTFFLSYFGPSRIWRPMENALYFNLFFSFIVLYCPIFYVLFFGGHPVGMTSQQGPNFHKMLMFEGKFNLF